MDGFIRVTDGELIRACRHNRHSPACVHLRRPNVMSYHDGSQIPNYWSYARNFVLQDHMFEPNWGWSLPAHLWLVSGWSAQCLGPYEASTCSSNLGFGPATPLLQHPHGPLYGWTDLTYLLHRHHVTWASYIEKGAAPDCLAGPIHCYTRLKGKGTPGFWNPLPDFTDVRQDHQQADSRMSLTDFYSAAADGSLPNVSWVTPDWADSNHPGAPIGQGQRCQAASGDDGRGMLLRPGRSPGLPDWAATRNAVRIVAAASHSRNGRPDCHSNVNRWHDFRSHPE